MTAKLFSSFLLSTIQLLSQLFLSVLFRLSHLLATLKLFIVAWLGHLAFTVQNDACLTLEGCFHIHLLNGGKVSLCAQTSMVL